MVEHLLERGVETEVVDFQRLSVVRDHRSDHKGLRLLLQEVVFELLEVREQSIDDLSGVPLATHVVRTDLNDENTCLAVVGLGEVEHCLLEVSVHPQTRLGLAKDEALVTNERLLRLQLCVVVFGDEMVPHQMGVADPDIANSSLEHVLGRHLKRND